MHQEVPHLPEAVRGAPRRLERLRRNLSAIINFAKFREDRQPGYVEFTQETDGLAQGNERTPLRFP